jgi:hypothetical protein
VNSSGSSKSNNSAMLVARRATRSLTDIFETVKRFVPAWPATQELAATRSVCVAAGVLRTLIAVALVRVVVRR